LRRAVPVAITTEIDVSQNMWVSSRITVTITEPER
jgi:hypothetical protein